MRKKKHIVENMVFVNHLPQSKDQFRERSELRRMDLSHVYLRRHHKSVDVDNNSITSFLFSILNLVFTIRDLPLLETSASIIQPTSHSPRCPLYSGTLRVGSKSHYSLDFASSSTKGGLLLFVLALIIQTLEPRVEALEINSSMASPKTDKGISSSTILPDAFNWSSGYFDPTFTPGFTANSASPGLLGSPCRVGGTPCYFGKCVDGKCVCDVGWDGVSCHICRGRGVLEGESGVIHDGHGNYTDSTTCTWLIKGPEKTRIRMNFAHFATECSWDHLYVYDGSSAFSPLLGIFSGLINVSPHPSNPELEYAPEIQTSSNVAYLHFYSDAAYNMTGFSINYTADYCDNGSCCPRNCSGAGACSVSGICDCDEGFLGNACRVPICDSERKTSSVSSKPSNFPERVLSYEDFECKKGPDGFWSLLRTKENSRSLPPLASHKAVVIGDAVYFVGGTSFSVDPAPRFMHVVSFGSKDVHFVDPIDSMSARSFEPQPRYGHSANLYKSSVYVFGGVTKGSIITNELLEYNTKKFSWTTINGNSSSVATSLAPPLAVSGHAAVVVGDVLIVIFGHSPIYGYVNHIQEFYFENKTWAIPGVSGAVVKGGYGHSATYVSSKQLIYVHGGLVSAKRTASHLVDSLFEYDPFKRFWRILRASGQPKYLHSTVELNGLLLSFGGNTHTDTAMSFGAKCFSSDFMAYDIACGRWHRLPAPEATLRHDVSRFGHSAVVYRDKMYVYGGFNGFMLGDSMVYFPGTCSHITTEGECLATRQGVKCVWASNKPELHCRTEEEARQLVKDKQIMPNLIKRPSCNSRTTATTQNEPLIDPIGFRRRAKRQVSFSKDCIFTDCASCVSNDFNCTWCSDTCHTSSISCNLLVEADPHVNGTSRASSEDRDSPMSLLTKCEGVQREATAQYCNSFHNCLACSAEAHCMWQQTTIDKRCVPLNNHQMKPLRDKNPDMTMNHYNPCESPCSSKTSCNNCTYGMCMWCDNVQRCVDSNAYVVSFPYGQCMAWANNRDICPVKRCSDIKTCDTCLKDPRCGWCDDGSRTGLGTCMEGGDDGPVFVHSSASRGLIPGVHHDLDSIVGTNSSDMCHQNRWHFTACPDCQCHGHAVCPLDSNECGECSGNAEGDHCQTCRDGFWGKPKLGKNCTACDCNHQAVSCDRNDGRCFCKTKGIIGDKCQKCDADSQYFGNPLNGSCFYQLKPDYHYTFNLSRPEDIYYTQINFRNMPQKPRKDVDFTLNCSQECKFNITFRSLTSNGERLILSGTCSQNLFEKKFKASQHHFGEPFNTTFFVYVYDFQGGNKASAWFHVKISFQQSPMSFSLVNLFIIFFSCFLSLLLVGAVVWKIKQRYDNYRRRQRAYVEMEQMASRPFAMVCPDLSTSLSDICPVLNSIKQTPRSKPTCPSPIALEPCADGKAAVLSLLVVLPQGDEEMAPPGTTGLLIGSTLVNLGANRKSSESAKLHREGWSSRKGGSHSALKDAANASCRNTHNPSPRQPQPHLYPPPNDDSGVWGI